MGYYVKITYRGISSIVKFAEKSAEAIHRDVKRHFNIKGNIVFKDEDLSSIPDDILVDYIDQYRKIPGWYLEAFDINPETFENVIEYELEEIEPVAKIVNDHICTESKIPVLTTSQEDFNNVNIQSVVANEEYETEISSLVNKEVLDNFEDLDYKIIVHNKSSIENGDRTKLSKILIKYILERYLNIE
ncbi:uncharacterized protein LOC142230519 [Haematobia irritans]|uniref:uncharacterized protein LOC142230519 n=1 Tax=Haematobia irritans TaxID=7368 RepID=UPI003F4F4298